VKYDYDTSKAPAKDLTECLTVGQLIDALRALPSDRPVICEGYDSYSAATRVSAGFDEQGREVVVIE
jgi:hypothetical protein